MAYDGYELDGTFSVIGVVEFALVLSCTTAYFALSVSVSPANLYNEAISYDECLSKHVYPSDTYYPEHIKIHIIQSLLYCNFV